MPTVKNTTEASINYIRISWEEIAKMFDGDVDSIEADSDGLTIFYDKQPPAANVKLIDCALLGVRLIWKTKDS
jgi:hypothetical protein